MRVLLFTGKGGVGKTTAAAGTAALAARRGHKTLVLSTDAAHSLADAFGARGQDSWAGGAAAIGAEPVEVDTGLFLQQVDTRRRFERTWSEVQRYLVAVLDAAGVDAIEAEELTVLPGADEVLALLEVRDQVRCGRWDVVVVDCAPTAETLRLLALPEALRWYMDRVFPAERRLVRSLRPVLSRVAGVPMPHDAVFDAVERLHAELADVRAVLTDPATASVRLVLTPESVVVAEARRTLTSLSLYGYRVDGVIANRVFPDDGADPWRAGWVAAQGAVLADVAASFAPLPVYRAAYSPREPIGLDALASFAATAYGDADVLGPPAVPGPLAVQREEEQFVLTIALPFAQRGEVELARKADELVVTVGAHRRAVALPSALRRCVVTGASLEAGRLAVRFRPDPSLWMTP